VSHKRFEGNVDSRVASPAGSVKAWQTDPVSVPCYKVWYNPISSFLKRIIEASCGLGEIQAAESTAPNPFGFILSRRTETAEWVQHRGSEGSATTRNRQRHPHPRTTITMGLESHGIPAGFQQQPCGPGAPAPFADCETKS
jgi:hypothetical protein